MKYNIGTINVTNSSAAVVGVGTKWVANLAAGQMFTVVGSGIVYYVGSITDDTHLTLTANYAGTTATAQPYTIVQSFTPGNSIPYPDIGDVQTATILKRALAIIDGLLTTVTATTAQFQSKTATVNTTNKIVGKGCFNTTTNKELWPTGTLNTSTWVDATGTVVYTPV